jgi:hypothetical protein
MSNKEAAGAKEETKEITLNVTNFDEEYGGAWSKLSEKVKMMAKEVSRGGGASKLETLARVHVVIGDRAVKEIVDGAFYRSEAWKITAPFAEQVGHHAFFASKTLVEVNLPNVDTARTHVFSACPSLRKVSLPNARSIGACSFENCFDLRHIALNPRLPVLAILTSRAGEFVFDGCLSLEVLAASSRPIGTYLSTPDLIRNQWPTNRPFYPTKMVTRYLNWRNKRDVPRDEMYRMLALLKLCCKDEDDDAPARATTSEPVMKFLVENGCGKFGFAAHLLSFCPLFYFEKTCDLRGAAKGELLNKALELKVVRAECNKANQLHWGVRVDANGKIADMT